MKRHRTENINTVEYWDREYTRRGGERSERIDIVAELLRRAGLKKVLDIGCGDGTVYGQIREHWGCDYYGTDFSEVAIERAKKEYPDAHFAVAKYHDQPFDSASFDAVISQETMEHVESPPDLAKEMLRLTRPGGVCILTTPLGRNLSGHEEHVWLFERADIKEMFKGCKVQFVEGIFPQLIIAIIFAPV